MRIETSSNQVNLTALLGPTGPQIAQDKKEMIKNVIRQLNTKIEQKQQSVAAAAQTDAVHMARMKEVHCTAHYSFNL